MITLNTNQTLNLNEIYSIGEEAIAEELLEVSPTAGDIVQSLTNTNTNPVALYSADGVSLTNPYLDLVTSEHKKTKFLKLVDLLTKGFYENSLLLGNLASYFDIDLAIGKQLDVIGQWVGISRVIQIPLTGAFFSFNTNGLGWDEGYWNQSLGSTDTSLSDDAYRRVLKARIALNMWDGTINSAVQALQIALPNNHIFIQDGGCSSFGVIMQMNVYISGNLDPIDQALITKGYYDFRPSGVKISSYKYSKILAAVNIQAPGLNGVNIGMLATTL